MPFKRKNNEDPISPNHKYRGILYTAKRKPISDNELPKSNKEDTASLSDVINHLSRAVSRPGARPSSRQASLRRGSGGKNIYLKASETKKAPMEKFEPSAEKEGRRSYSYSGKRRQTRDIGFFKGHFIRNTIIICAAIFAVSSIAITTSFARPKTNITLKDGLQEGSRILEAETAALTVGEFLEDNKIEIGPDDLLENDPSQPIEEGMEIIIRRGMPVTVSTGNDAIVVNMIAGTVGDALIKAGVEPAPGDEIYPARETYIRPGMSIEHVVVDVEEQSESHEIPYDETTKEDSTLAKGSTEVRQYGETGELEITTQYTYKNGVLTSEEIISEEVIKEPIDEIIAVGTYVAPKKPTPVKTSSIHSGSASEYQGGGKYQVTVTVTAYCSNCNSGNRTSTGVYPSYGTVAAKTSQFPYGTVLYIPGYGYGRVEDTGGFGANTIDIYMGDQPDESACNAWGRRTVTITVN